jgi:hypothetical protein
MPDGSARYKAAQFRDGFYLDVSIACLCNVSGPGDIKTERPDALLRKIPHPDHFIVISRQDLNTGDCVVYSIGMLVVGYYLAYIVSRDIEHIENSQAIYTIRIRNGQFFKLVGYRGWST